MENWSKIDDILYKENKYTCLINDKNQIFYLKVDEDGKMQYPTIEELVDLMTQFNYQKFVRVYKFELPSFKPMVYVKKKVVPVAVALSMLFPNISGGHFDIDTYPKNGIQLEQMNDEETLYEVTGVDTSLMNGQLAWLTPEYFGNISFEKTCSPIDFSNYTGEKNLTWEDIQKTIEESEMEGLDEEQKEQLKAILQDGVSNLKEYGANYNLAVLNYNLKNLKIESVDPKVLEEQNACATFQPIGSIVTIPNGYDFNNDREKKVIQHEILGHGSTMAYIPDKVYCNVQAGYINIDENGNLNSYGFLGTFATEAIADIISSYASNMGITDYDTDYTTEVYALSTLLKANNYSIDDFINYGIKGLTEKMKEQGISNPTQYIMKLDQEKLFMSENVALGTDKTYYDIFTDYFLESSLSKAINGESVDDIRKWAEESLENYKNVICLDEYNGREMIAETRKENVNLIKPNMIKDGVIYYIEDLRGRDLDELKKLYGEHKKIIRLKEKQEKELEIAHNKAYNTNLDRDYIEESPESIKKFSLNEIGKKVFSKDNELTGSEYEESAKKINRDMLEHEKDNNIDK